MALIAEHSSERERRAERAEREILQWKKVRFLADRVGESFHGRITGVQPFGLFVRLDEYFVDGFVPVRVLSDDFYSYEPDRHRLVGRRHGRIFRLADSVEVELAGIDSVHRSLDLVVTGQGPEEPVS
ncbi:MAG TPA: S1 RNA-binding domain-containing protein [Thermoanaerobaculia bacterium]|nr:S1 RNA-binding domain-containing protein [Thermoanaerobaculia bacterium]